jgi:hypothetical protein
VLDRELAATIEADFFEDLGQSDRLSLSSIEQSWLSEEDESLLDHILKQES